MCLAVELDGNQSDPLLEEVVRLRIENANLRDMLGIANIKIDEHELLPARKKAAPPPPEPAGEDYPTSSAL